MSESFVKTFKRDYVRCNPCPNAAVVLAQLESWFEEYNGSHPHSALRMLSPREFIQANSSLVACPARWGNSTGKLPGVISCRPFSRSGLAC